MSKELPHSRACGITQHKHGIACHHNCPTCHGKRLNSAEYNTMSDLPDKPKLDTDQLKAKAEEVLNGAPEEVKEAVQKSKGFYEENKKVIHAVLVGAVVLKVYKRKVAKASAKAVVKAIVKSDKIQPFNTVASDLPSMFDIWEGLKATPNMAYIPHGAGMVHLLGPSKDVVVTAFGDFSRMSNEEIFDYTARALRLR